MGLEETGIKRRRRIDGEKQRQVIELYRDHVPILSIQDVAEQLGISYTTAWRILGTNNEPRRSISEACMKYPKTDFSGDPAELARIIGFMEDCSAEYCYKQIHVQTSTTHPSQIELCDNRLEQYGHISRTPGYHKQYAYYRWHLQIYLKRPSFDFLIEYKRNPLKFLNAQILRNDTIYIYIGSLTDAEGSIGLYDDDGHPRVALQIANSNRQILRWCRTILGGGISQDKSSYLLQLYGDEAIEALRRLPITHEEKAAAQQLVLRYVDNRDIGIQAVQEYRELRRRIDDEVRLCTMQARLEWIERHGKPHKDDPDQTIPPF